MRLLLVVLALALPGFALGEVPEVPGRAARLSHVEGGITFQGADAPVQSTLPDRPLAPGDRLVTEPGARAEITLGTAAVRLDGRTELVVRGLEAMAVRLEVSSGTVGAYLRELLEGETFEIRTPGATITLREPGDYRIDVPGDSSTVLTVRAGDAEVATATGSVRVAEGQRVRLDSPNAFAKLEAPAAGDAFDEWIHSRERQVEEAQSARYALRDGVGYDELDRYGEWYDEPSYGRVWIPSYSAHDWAPFRFGHWERIGVHGWTWIDPVPWGIVTFHRGRWAYLHHLGRWCWVPGPRIHPRRFVHETSPLGRPREHGADASDPGRPPRNVRWRTQDDGFERPLAITRGRPVGADGPTTRRTVPSERLRREDLDRNLNRGQLPPRRLATAPRPSGEAASRGGTDRSEPAGTTRARPQSEGSGRATMSSSAPRPAQQAPSHQPRRSVRGAGNRNTP